MRKEMSIFISPISHQNDFQQHRYNFKSLKAMDFIRTPGERFEFLLDYAFAPNYADIETAKESAANALS